MVDFYHVYVKSTQPDWTGGEAPPAPGLRDPQFRITIKDATGAAHQVAITPSIQLSPAWSRGQVFLHSASLHCGWLRSRIAYLALGHWGSRPHP